MGVALSPIEAETCGRYRCWTRVSASVLTYWLLWLALAAVYGRLYNEDAVTGWWMVMGGLYLTVVTRPSIDDVAPGPRWICLPTVTIAVAWLLYGTLDWFLAMTHGLSFGEWGYWTRRVCGVTQIALAVALTALTVAVPLRRVLGASTHSVLLISGMAAGLAEVGHSIATLSEWRTHFFSNALRLFLLVSLPLFAATAAHRLPSVRSNAPRLARGTAYLWEGRLPLWTNLLIVYPVTLWAAFKLPTILEQLLEVQASDFAWRRDTVAAAACVLMMVALASGSIVTWRCLSFAASRQERGARVAQGLVALISAPFLCLVFGGYGFRVGQVITDSAAAALGGPYDLKLSADGKELRLDGVVNYGLSDRIAKQLAQHPGIRRLRLQSPGGLLEEGVNSAKIVRAHNLDTVVSDDCSSACTLIFLAGRERSLDGRGKLGFHEARDPDPFRVDAFRIRSLYAKDGVSAPFLKRVSAVKQPATWFPTRRELMDAGVLTATSSAH